MSQVCQHCGTELPSDAPGGICPYCVLKLGDSNPGHANATAAYPGTATLPPPDELAAMFPQLEILGLLGRGGMGVVYKARQATLDRLVALKILPVDVGRDPTFAERFSREARALARLSHPNIVAVYDSGERDGLFYFIMEYVDGVNLRQAIKAEQMTPDKALAIVPQICDALQYAHEEGVVHRDIKPENVLLDRKGRVKVADFGLAKLLGLASPDITLTGTYQAMGTLHYMAPEQYEKPQAVDHRADIYSLGVVFYELLTGKLPLGRFELPSEKVQIDVRLDQVVLKTMEREPERRYQYASEVRTEVDSIAHTPQPVRRATPPVQERVFAPLPPSPPAPRREISDLGRLLAILGGVALAMLPLLCLSSVLFGYVGIGETTLRGTALLGFAGGFLFLVAGVILLVMGLSLKQSASDPSAIPPEKAPDAARRRREQGEQAVRVPGLVLLILGALDCALVLAVGLAGDAVGNWPDVMVLAAVVLHIAAAIVICAGASCLRGLRNYPLAMAGAIAAILPIHFAWPLGLPIGIWVLAVLCRSNVRQGFGVEAPAGRVPARGPALSIATIVLLAAAALLFVPVLVCGFGFTRTAVAPRAPSPPSPPSPAWAMQGETKLTPESINWLDWTEAGPRLDSRVPQVSGLRVEQLVQINAALAKAHKAYLEVEAKHTERKENELGHQVVTVKQFSKELTRLEDEFWTDVDEAVTDNFQRGMLRERLTARGDLFPFGGYDQTVELWKVGAWYHYQYQNGGSQRGPELPRNVKHLWQPPKTRSTEAEKADH